ncbi:MAG: hypothetical protein JSR99_18565 [Proteobacteria bacterium]|nr:hypothetical protein [Pseudomonadota bacterium]
MTRLALIAAAAMFALASAAAGAAFYLRPTFIFGSPEAKSLPVHGIPTYAEDKNEKTQIRKRALLLVEQLGAVQDRIIRGDRAALADQAQLLSEIARHVRRFTDEDWDDYVNVRTSLLYVLSGGDAHVLKPLVDRNTLSPADQNLASGIMSFAEGQSRNARTLFDGIDPRSLDVSLVGPFALARASLYLDDDHTKAIDLLDDARLAGPHTAIDEAAARREIPILLNGGNTERALMLTVSYAREFGRSIYAWKLFREFSEAAAKHPELDDPAIVDRLAESFDQSDVQAASELFVDLAGEALLQGRLKLAAAAAKRVLEMEKASPENLEKARLYLAAAEAPSSDASNALKALDQITADRLSEDDTEIREVAGFIARTVVGGSEIENSHSASAFGAHQTEQGTGAEVTTAIKASAALKNADALLKEADLIISGSTK